MAGSAAGRHRLPQGEDSLVSAAQAKLRDWDLRRLPSPFSADGLCELVSQRRGRPIKIQDGDIGDVNAPCGLWIETGTTDYFVVARGATPAHREHIVVHELAHVLYDHQGVLGKDHLHLALPHLNESVIRRMLGRGSYGPHEEQEAEVLASVIMAQVEQEEESFAQGRDRDVLLGLSQLLE